MLHVLLVGQYPGSEKFRVSLFAGQPGILSWLFSARLSSVQQVVAILTYYHDIIEGFVKKILIILMVAS